MKRLRRATALLVMAPLVTALAASAGVPPAAAGAPPSPTVSPPAVSAEHAVSDPVRIPRAGHQNTTAVASNGDGFLAVWADGYRSGLFGTRLSAAGEVLDPGEIAVSPGGGVVDPSISWDGTNYLVVWTSEVEYPSSRDVFAARVTPQGTVLDPQAIPMGVAGGSRTFPAVAFNGTHHLVVWTDVREGGTESDLYATRLAPDGTVLDPGGIPVSTTAGPQLRPDVASDGDGFLVVWKDGLYGDAHLEAARVTAAGEVLDPEGVPLTTTVADYNAVDWDGSRYVAVWSDYRNGNDYDLFGRAVGTDGIVVGGEFIIAASPDFDSLHPSVVGDGSGAFVVWSDYPIPYPMPGSPAPWRMSGARITAAGGVGPAVRVGTGRGPAVAFNGSVLLVSWQSRPDVLPGPYPPDDDVYAARIDPGGNVMDEPPILLASSANSQLRPAVAWNGRNYLVAWRDYGRRVQSDLYMARVSPTGEALDGSGVRLPLDGDDPVRVASNGDGYLVVMSNYGGATGVRVDGDGRLIDSSPFVIPSAPGGVATHSLEVASDGTDYLVVWQQNNPSNEYRPEIAAFRIPAIGPVPSGSPVRISDGDDYNPALAWNGETYLVVWLQAASPGKGGPPAASRPGVTAIRVDRSGGVLDRRPTFVAAGNGDELRHPAVAASTATRTFLVAWDNLGSDYTPTMITEGIRIDGAGRQLDHRPLVLARPEWEFDPGPTLSWDGTNFVLVWNPGSFGAGDILGGRIDEAGNALDSLAGFPVAATAAAESEPSVAAGTSGRTAVVYVRRAMEAPCYDAPRAFVRFVDEP